MVFDIRKTFGKSRNFVRAESACTKSGLSKRDSGLITGDLIVGFWED